MKKIEIISISIAVIFGTFSVIYAAPSVPPTGGNIARPIFGNEALVNGGSNLVSPQAIVGAPAGNATSADVVPRGLSVGTAMPTPPGYGQTLFVNGITAVGSFTLSNDPLTVQSNMTVGGDLIVCKTPAGAEARCTAVPTATDGKIIISGLENSAVSAPRPLCVNSSHQIVLCTP